MSEMMSDAHVAEAAEQLAEAYQMGLQIPQFPMELRPRSASDAARVQDALAAALAWPVVGWKVGHNSVAARKLMGPDAPVTGRFFDHMVVSSPAVVALSELCFPIVEAEISVRLGRGLPPRSSVYSIDEVAESIGDVIPSIEFPDFRHDWSNGFDPFSALEVTASNAGAFRLILGEPLTDWSPERLASIEAEIFIDGVSRGRGVTGDDRVDPLWTVCYLANELSRRGVGLEEGQIIATGLVAEAVPLNSVGRVSVVFHGLGEVLLSVVG